MSQSNKSSLRQFLQGRILTSSKAAHLYHQRFLWWSVDDRKAEWELIAERSRHKPALLTLQLHFWSLFINCCFNHKLFHWACMKNFVFIHWRSLYKAGLWTVIFVPFGLETSDRRKPGNYINAWARAGRQIKLLMFLFLCFLVWPYNRHLINRARSPVQTSLHSVCTGDLGQDSPIQTFRSVNKS